MGPGCFHPAPRCAFVCWGWQILSRRLCSVQPFNAEFPRRSPCICSNCWCNLFIHLSVPSTSVSSASLCHFFFLFDWVQLVDRGFKTRCGASSPCNLSQGHWWKKKKTEKTRCIIILGTNAYPAWTTTNAKLPPFLSPSRSLCLLCLSATAALTS